MYKVKKSQASAKKNRFEFQFPGDDKAYSVPKAQYLPPSLVAAIGDDKTDVQIVSIVLNKLIGGNILDKFEDAAQLSDWFDAWQEASGLDLGESVASGE